MVSQQRFHAELPNQTPGCSLLLSWLPARDGLTADEYLTSRGSLPSWSLDRWSFSCTFPMTKSLLPPSSIQFSHSVVSDSLWPHGLQHAKLPCTSPTARVYPNPCSLSQWCHPTISSSVVPFSSCLQSFQASGSFFTESVLHIKWLKYWNFSFSISPSNEYSGLISFRIDWLDLLAVQETLKSFL